MRTRRGEGRWRRPDLGRTTDGRRRCGAVWVKVAGLLGRGCWFCRRRRHGFTRAGVDLQGDWLRDFEVGVPGLIVRNTGTVFRINGRFFRRAKSSRYRWRCARACSILSWAGEISRWRFPVGLKTELFRWFESQPSYPHLLFISVWRSRCSQWRERVKAASSACAGTGSSNTAVSIRVLRAIRRGRL